MYANGHVDNMGLKDQPIDEIKGTNADKQTMSFSQVQLLWAEKVLCRCPSQKDGGYCGHPSHTDTDSIVGFVKKGFCLLAPGGVAVYSQYGFAKQEIHELASSATEVLKSADVKVVALNVYTGKTPVGPTLGEFHELLHAAMQGLTEHDPVVSEEIVRSILDPDAVPLYYQALIDDEQEHNDAGNSPITTLVIHKPPAGDSHGVCNRRGPIMVAGPRNGRRPRLKPSTKPSKRSGGASRVEPASEPEHPSVIKDFILGSTDEAEPKPIRRKTTLRR